MIIRQHRIYRVDLQANPDVMYLFGDNLQRVGMGGQAGEMRGEPNAVGIATKKTPTSGTNAYFTDDEYDFNKRWLDDDLEAVKAHLFFDGLVVLPLDGLGTGLSEMPTRCPKTFEYLEKNLEVLMRWHG